MLTPDSLAELREPTCPAQLTTNSASIVAVVGPTPDAPLRRVRDTPVTADALHDRRALLPGALGQRHRHVDGVHPAVLLDVEAGEDVVGAGQREQLGDLARPRSRATSTPQ